MAIQPLNTIKNWFKTGLKPSQNQFWETWDSFRHKFEKVPMKDVENLETSLNTKAEKTQFENHLSDSRAHQELFTAKEDKYQKGIAGGYVPLDEFRKITTQYLNIIDDSITGGSDCLLSAEQGKVLQNQINGIHTLLQSDNLNLDTIQEIADAIGEMQLSLETILVNDLTTGGVTKALTAEMGKQLQETKLEGAIATDEETQIRGEIPEDNKLISRSKLFNWWEWQKTQYQIFYDNVSFSKGLLFGEVGYMTFGAYLLMRARQGSQLSLGIEGASNDAVVINEQGLILTQQTRFLGGTSENPSFILDKGNLTTVPQEGAIERDDNGVLWDTNRGIRSELVPTRFSKNLSNGTGSNTFVGYDSIEGQIIPAPSVKQDGNIYPYKFDSNTEMKSGDIIESNFILYNVYSPINTYPLQFDFMYSPNKNNDSEVYRSYIYNWDMAINPNLTIKIILNKISDETVYGHLYSHLVLINNEVKFCTDNYYTYSKADCRMFLTNPNVGESNILVDQYLSNNIFIPIKN